ncbi:MAG TPA: hypothetical protein VJ110_01930 [Candidatus Nanoarchaeia archaeon]|nr:hypothetical protein [Candidatus Nanoarchaeia archaeon]
MPDNENQKWMKYESYALKEGTFDDSLVAILKEFNVAHKVEKTESSADLYVIAKEKGKVDYYERVKKARERFAYVDQRIEDSLYIDEDALKMRLRASV